MRAAERATGHPPGTLRIAMIRMLDHTADVGFELEAPTLDGLFEEAGRALLMVVLDRPPRWGGDRTEVQLSAPDREMLLVRWLNELTYLVQDLRFVPAGAEVRVCESSEAGCRLDASLTGVPLDVEKHGWQGEVKSATFHGLDVIDSGGRWHARVILDV